MNYKAQVQAYIDRVLSGAIVTGRLVRLCVERHVLDLKLAGERGFYFSEEHALEAIRFFPTVCRHSIGQWDAQPFELSPWQMFVVWCVFGWRQLSDDLRRFRKVFISVGRKNGKSTWCSSLALLLLCFDNPIEAGAEIYVAATKEDQANIIHREAERMVKKSPSLRRLTQCFKKNITVPHNNSYFRPLGSDSDNTDGLNPHGVFKDELHAWRERHRGLDEKLSSGGAARRQPLEVVITTAGDDKSTIWQEESDYAAKVVESVVTGEIVSDTYFAYVACIDFEDRPCVDCEGDECGKCDGEGVLPKDDPFDERNWIKANPNLNVSVKLDYLRDKANEAKQKPTARNSFLRYHCNVRTSSTEKAITPELWDSCKGELSDLLGREAYGGFDLGRSNDFAGIGLVFPFDTGKQDEDGKTIQRYEIKAWAFTCEDRSDDLLKEPRLARWIEEKRLEVHYGEDVDFSAIEDRIVELSKLYDVRSWAYDETFAKQTAQNLFNKHGITIFPFSQSARFYNEPIRQFLKVLREKRVKHDGDPLLAWQADNLTIRKNPKDEWMPDKAVSRNKIDSCVALLMAFSEALFAERQTGPLFYSG